MKDKIIISFVAIIAISLFVAYICYMEYLDHKFAKENEQVEKDQIKMGMICKVELEKSLKILSDKYLNNIETNGYLKEYDYAKMKLEVEQLELKIEEKFNINTKITIEASQTKVNKGEPVYLHIKAYDINDYMEDIKLIKDGIAS